GEFGSGACGNTYEFRLYALSDAAYAPPGGNITTFRDDLVTASEALGTSFARLRSGPPDCNPSTLKIRQNFIVVVFPTHCIVSFHRACMRCLKTLALREVEPSRAGVQFQIPHRADTWITASHR